MNKYITGVVNQYFNTAEDRDAGLRPRITDEVYASCQQDGTWAVYRATTEIVMPKLMRSSPSILARLREWNVRPSPLENARVLRQGCTLREAFEIIRDQDISPPAVPGLVHGRLYREDDSPTYWRNIPQPSA